MFPPGAPALCWGCLALGFLKPAPQGMGGTGRQAGWGTLAVGSMTLAHAVPAVEPGLWEVVTGLF